ncbi:MAG TPA: hypothetical protein VLA46_13605, partial [Saprospiraceae bacterium]|nr:hypothetical protein [Saprospiraceae bacterium]
MALLRFFLGAFFLLCFVQACKPDLKQSALSGQDKNELAAGSVQSIAYQWAEIALQATARDTERFKPRPTVTSRYLGLLFVAMFDAWSRYDSSGLPVYLDGV